MAASRIIGSMTDVVRPVGVLRTQVEIRTYPRDDEAFQHLVLEQLRRFDRIRHAAAIPARLETLLHEQYPRARSRYQDPLASTAGMPLLYVFRDGGLLAEEREMAIQREAPTTDEQPALAMSGGTSTAA
jgi:hypothetical protein